MLGSTTRIAMLVPSNERGGQQLSSGVSGGGVEEVKVEPVVEEEMAGNQRQEGGAQARHMNVAAGEEGAPRTMGYYMAPRPADIQSPILHPTVAANNFEIKLALVTMIQSNTLFHGNESESPREHVQRLLELAGILKINGVPVEALQLIFPYSLLGKALRWLNNRPPRSITSWDDLLNKFMARYCPPSKMVEWRKKINVERHFSKLKLASNGVEDQSRALGDSCLSLSLSRNCSLSQKLESPSVWLKICLKRHQWPKHGRGHGRDLPEPARVSASVNYTASSWGETRPCFAEDTAVLWWNRAVLWCPCLQLNLPNRICSRHKKHGHRNTAV
ncbi:unnamed protein product [Linum trigynum]|uniref:Retrotransposon gag domain-containing protein n=1 Tax=Linum trigynum TaxID=586398 RepID=A0AAV2CTQ1_9ROSI